MVWSDEQRWTKVSRTIIKNCFILLWKSLRCKYLKTHTFCICHRFSYVVYCLWSMLSCFQLEEDTENFMRYKVMTQEGKQVSLRLKRGTLPHKFHCQIEDKPTLERLAAVERRRLVVLVYPGTSTSGNNNERYCCEIVVRVNRKLKWKM